MSRARRKRYLEQWLRYRWRCRNVGGFVTVRGGFANAAVAVLAPAFRRRMEKT